MEPRPQGLRYEGCAAVLERHPGLDVPAVWDGLRVIEDAFVTAWERKREQQGEGKKGRNGRKRRG
jgi:hypothetical protein